MPKSINVEVFNDTKKKCKTNVKLINSINNSIEKGDAFEADESTAIRHGVFCNAR